MTWTFRSGRQCLHQHFRFSRQHFTSHQFPRFLHAPRVRQQYKWYWPFARPPPPPYGRTLLVSSLSPAAFVLLGEADNDDGKTHEEHMLEVSRAEIDELVPEFLEGPNKAILRSVWFFVDNWIVEPIFTGFRFLHLVVIFVPVILAIPVIWLGSRNPRRDNERSGTLWWYGFLVGSMERAGAAFIKVRPSCEAFARNMH